MVIDLYRIGQRDRLAIGEVIEIMIRRGERPALRALRAADGIVQRSQRQPAELYRAVGEARHRAGGVNAGDPNVMRIGQIGIRERDRAACGIQRRRTVGAGAFCNGHGLRFAGDLGFIVAAGNDDGDRIVTTPPCPSLTVAV